MRGERLHGWRVTVDSMLRFGLQTRLRGRLLRMWPCGLPTADEVAMTRGRRIGGKYSPQAGYTVSVELSERLGDCAMAYRVLDALFDRLHAAIARL